MDAVPAPRLWPVRTMSASGHWLNAWLITCRSISSLYIFKAASSIPACAENSWSMPTPNWSWHVLSENAKQIKTFRNINISISIKVIPQNRLVFQIDIPLRKSYMDLGHAIASVMKSAIDADPLILITILLWSRSRHTTNGVTKVRFLYEIYTTSSSRTNGSDARNVAVSQRQHPSPRYIQRDDI